MQPKTLLFISWTCLLGISGTLALLLTSSSAKASVANLAPDTTPGYVVRFDTKLALTNSTLFVNGYYLDWLPGGTNSLRFAPDTGGRARIYNPFFNYIYIGDGATSSTLTVAESSTDNVFFGGGGTIALDVYGPAGDPYSGKRLELSNIRSATVGVQQIAPHLVWIGRGWDADDAVSRVISFTETLVPVQGNVVTADLIIQSQLAAGGTVTNLNLRSNSGWTGAGTRVLYDDGYFKVAPVSATFNPTSTFVPYNNAGSWSDSWWYYTANGMGTATNMFLTNAAGYSMVFTLAGNNPTINGNGGNGLYFDSANALHFQRSGTTIWLIGSGNNNLITAVDGTGSIGNSGNNRPSDVYVTHGLHINTNSIVIPSGGGFSFQTNSAEVFRIPGGAIWDDSMVPEALVRVGASAPSQANFNGGPGQTLQFQNNRDDAILASVQLSHRYKQGTDVYPHVHWAETATTGAGTNIVWELQYTWANPDAGVFPAYSTNLMTNSITGTNWWHSMESFPSISGTGRAVSAIMVFQLRRLANSATADDYNQNVAFLGFDLHYQVDAPGSDSADAKSF